MTPGNRVATTAIAIKLASNDIDRSAGGLIDGTETIDQGAGCDT